MSFFEGVLQVFWGNSSRTKQEFSGSVFHQISQSVSNSPCHEHGDEFGGCRDDSYALTLKLISIASILIAGVSGVAIPLIGKKHRLLRNESSLFVAAKAFAAGVILATGFVHMLPDATSALTNKCLPEFPWKKFPFSGFVAMMAALATLLADSVGTQYYERKLGKQPQPQPQAVVHSESEDSRSESGITPVLIKQCGGQVISHSQEQEACQCLLLQEVSHGHSHSHAIDIDNEESGVRNVIISQVLELGIVSHSVIIGLSLGVSQNPCTIGPLLGALSFHQLFEGFALGGCISDAQFQTLHSTLMAFFFAITTPFGIVVGIGVSSVYDGSSPRALVVEGMLDSVSAGILMYMALVDLIAATFLSKRMRSNVRLTVVSYVALFFGALLMSSLAAWA